MSRTYKTAPWTVRAAKLEGREVPKDWRERWDHSKCPRVTDVPAWDAWWNDRPSMPVHLMGRGRGRSTGWERNMYERKLRAGTRDAINRGEYDECPLPSRAWLD